MKQRTAWVALAALGLMLLIAAVQGSSGRFFAIVFVPDKVHVEDADPREFSGGGSGGSGGGGGGSGFG